MKKLLTIIIASLTLSSCSTSTSATKTIASTTPATLASTAPTTMPTETTTPKTVAVSTTATVQEDYPSQVLEVLRDSYEGIFEVNLNEENFVLTSTGVEFDSIFEKAMNDDSDAIASINLLATSLAEATGSFLDGYESYSVSVINPLNKEKVLIIAKNGSIEYNFLDEREENNISGESVEKQVLNLFEEIYGKQYDIRLKDDIYYMDPTDETIIQGITLAFEGQGAGSEFWESLQVNFNVVTENFPDGVKDYKLALTNPLDKTKLIFVSKKGETLYDALLAD